MSFLHHESTKGGKRERKSLSGFLTFGLSRLRRPLTSTLLCVLAASAAWSQATVKKIDYKGWTDCYEISNPVVRLMVVGQIGGLVQWCCSSYFLP